MRSNRFSIVTKGKGVYLLRKSAKFTSNRKAPKRYDIKVEDFKLHPALQAEVGDEAGVDEEEKDDHQE